VHLHVSCVSPVLLATNLGANLNSEMKTTDYTESTDTDDVVKEGLFIQQMSGACFAIF
jgi:hypothetical protein